jgi:molybdopterin-guanine dinucleotide biosynthesis protein B
MKRPAVIGFYGKSNSGKTTLIVEIIKRLTNEDIKVATIKITDKKIGIDTDGKDTWKYSKAGSELVVFSSSNETDFLLNENMGVNEILNHIEVLGEYDIVIVEGARDKNIPKIRLGDITERENTIFTYAGDLDRLIKIIKMKFLGGKK